MKHQVTISNHALEEMVLAAGESFVLGSALTDEREGAEIHGYLWGGRRTDESKDIEYIHIDKFSVSSSACGDEDSVWVDGDVACIKDSVLNLWAPHYHFLGDFHTHPYRDHDEVKENEGWQFSKRDIKSFKKDKQVWNLSGSNAPIMMVMAVTKMQKIHRTVLEMEADNRFMFNVGNLRFWLSIGIGKLGRGERRVFSEDVVWGLLCRTTPRQRRPRGVAPPRPGWQDTCRARPRPH